MKPMNQKILISTTNSIEGMEIERYFDLISTNVVLGTNVFSDIGASFSDFFGGTSDIYQSKLEKIYKAALDKLRQKAKNLSANGVVGVSIDFDEISGGGKSMFMISVTGMAVRLKSLKKSMDSEGEKKLVVQPEDLEMVVNKLKVISKVKSKKVLDVSDWEFLIENPVSEIISDLLDVYLEAFKHKTYAVSDSEQTLRKYFSALLRQLDFQVVSNLLYNRLSENSVVVLTLLKEAELFSPPLSIKQLETNSHIGIATLAANKRFYNSDDLKEMILILEIIGRFPSSGRIEVVKGLLGSKEKFICESNHQNDPIEEYCTNCGKNIKGLVKTEADQIEEFELKVEGLKILLN
jgi:uncharacterized protein YbjQ (UPF0145 family)